MLSTIIKNSRFLALEVVNQLQLTYQLLKEYDASLFTKIDANDDYIDNLKTTIENDCFSRIHGGTPMGQKEINDIRAFHIICVNLERIADYCVNIARQTHYLDPPSFLHNYDYNSMFEEIKKGISMIPQVYTERDLSGALKICIVEYDIDKLYKNIFDRILLELKEGREVENLITTNFICRYLERIGDCILNIGEALIFAIIGDRIKIRQFAALEETLGASGFKGSLKDIDFSTIWGSRSGCRISRVGEKRPSGYHTQGIFKEGVVNKIRKEHDNLKRWDELYPGLVPHIFGYKEKESTASLLVEFLPGCTLDQIVITQDADMFNDVIFIFEQTMFHIWDTTKKEESFKTDYMRQLNSRMDGILRVHRKFYRERLSLGDYKINATRDLMQSCETIEENLPAPFTIFIHGDFNANNIVYNHDAQKIHFIDLYRSKHADYIQDASVLLVSFYRLPVFDTTMRKRINDVVSYFYTIFKEFAEKNNDWTFEARMALALARSFYTSSRFEMHNSFAKTMYLQAEYLLTKVVNHSGKDFGDFKLPLSVLHY